MSIITCPECGKDISDQAEACPHCGFPLKKTTAGGQELQRAERSKRERVRTAPRHSADEKKAPRKKRIIIPVGIICLLLILGIGGFLVTRNPVKYNEAEELLSAEKYLEASVIYSDLGKYKDSAEKYNVCQYNYAKSLFEGQKYPNAAEIYQTLGDYSDSQEMYNECRYLEAAALYAESDFKGAMDIYAGLGTYKDSEALLKDCKYQETVDGQFMRALAKGLMSRWDISESVEADSVEGYDKCILCELDNISSFYNLEFQDKDLQVTAKSYIDALNQSREVLKYADTDYQKYNESWAEIYNKRIFMIKTFSEEYGLKLDEKYDDTIETLFSEAKLAAQQNEIQDSILKMAESADFELISSEYGGYTYQASVKNTTAITFRFIGFVVDLKNEKGTILESAYTNQLAYFAPGDEGIFQFTTAKDFSGMQLRIEYYYE